MTRLVPPAAGPLRGTVAIPGDKSISHRAVLFAPLADGPVRVRGFLRAADTLSSLAAVRALGAEVADDGRTLTVSRGRFPDVGAAPPDAPVVAIDCGNSGTTTRLLLGLLAGRRVRARLDGDASLRRRPMARVVEPLRALGADIRYEGEEGRLPLLIVGAALRGGEHALKVPSAQVASALLLAGLAASGPVAVSGCRGARDHTQRLLGAMGADLATEPDAAVLRSGAPLRAVDIDVPGDPSSAAFLLGAALLVPGSGISVPNVLLNPTRTGFLDAMREMGADLEVRPATGGGEPMGTVGARTSLLRGIEIAGAARVATLVDEVPLLAVLAARAAGATRLRDAAELRVKESDRLAATAAGLRALGVRVDESPDGLDIVGNPAGFTTRGPAAIATHGDHRLAMAFAVAALASTGGATLDDEACVAVSFPEFFAVLERLTQRGGSSMRCLHAGESHGPALVSVIEGFPAGVPLTEADLDGDLRRRLEGHGRGLRAQSIETDACRLLAGLWKGRTLGSPLAILIENRDFALRGGKPHPDWPAPRPGHADLPGMKRYLYEGFAPVAERASARSTAGLVAVGACARRLLHALGIEIASHTVAVGGLAAAPPEPTLARLRRVRSGTPLRCLDRRAEKEHGRRDR